MHRIRPPTLLNGPLLITVALALFLSCRQEPEATFVDFSKRLAVKNAGAQTTPDTFVKVAVGSMISARETAVHYHQLLDYIAGKLGRRIQLVQRKTYGEINELIGLGQIDLAFICSGPYVSGKAAYGFEALAMPVVRGSYPYRSYLIVNKNSAFQKLEDLRGATFAFSDPESNTGKLVPTYWLRQQRETPESFFAKTIYTYSHDNSIMAVAMSLVDAAAVNGQVWEYYHHRKPVFTSQTRVIKKSRFFGNPPVVASSHMPQAMRQHIRRILFAMHQDPEGKKILDELLIDRFIAPMEQCYLPILAMKNSRQG